MRFSLKPQIAVSFATPLFRYLRYIGQEYISMEFSIETSPYVCSNQQMQSPTGTTIYYVHWQAYI